VFEGIVGAAIAGARLRMSPFRIWHFNSSRSGDNFEPLIF
jgi:hypothetical protein